MRSRLVPIDWSDANCTCAVSLARSQSTNEFVSLAHTSDERPLTGANGAHVSSFVCVRPFAGSACACVANSYVQMQ